MRRKGIRYLFRYKRRYSRKYVNRRTLLLYLAIQGGHEPLVKYLLRQGGLRINARVFESRLNLLHIAAYYGRYSVSNLVFAGCYINSRDPDTEDMALHIAIRNHHIEVAIKLIRLGADVGAQNKYLRTPLQLALTNQTHADLVKMIPNGRLYRKLKFYGLYSLYVASRDRNVEMIRYCTMPPTEEEKRRELKLIDMLLMCEANVNNKDENGCSPIQCAIYKGDRNLVKTLIDWGADVNSQNCIGASALHDAVLTGDYQMVLLLLKWGANVFVKTRILGETPLHWAAWLNRNSSHDYIIHYLLAHGSDVSEISTPENDFITPFNNIVANVNLNLVKFCIAEFKADLKKLTLKGQSNMEFAIHNPDENVLRFVLESGVTCPEGMSKLNFVSLWHRPRCVRKLIEEGANVNERDKRPAGLTSLMFCIASIFPKPIERPNLEEDRRQVIRLLLEAGADLNLKARTRPPWTCLELAICLGFVEERNIILEHALEVTARTNEPVFDEYNMTVINRDLETKIHYENCLREFTAMKARKIGKTSITYFSVMTKPPNVLARYKRNKSLIKAFEASDYEIAYPIYGKRLREKLIAPMPGLRSTQGLEIW